MQRGAWKRKACRGGDCCSEREEIVSWIFGVGSICWQSPIFLNADLSNISAPESLTDNIAFVGTWNPATLTADDKTVLYLQSDNTLYYPTADTPVRAFHAYFNLIGITAGDLASSIKNFVLSFDNDDATSLSEELRMRNEETAAAREWFTLDGRRLNGKPAKSGIYINGGQKVLVK